MSESQLLAAVLEMAGTLGWTCYHARPARSASGWRTASQGNGASGFPDLVLARRGRLIFAELKTEKGTIRPEQQAWLEQLRQPVTGGNGPRFDEGTDTRRDVAAEVYVWRPSRWLDGTIERVLR